MKTFWRQKLFLKTRRRCHESIPTEGQFDETNFESNLKNVLLILLKCYLQLSGHNFCVPVQYIILLLTLCSVNRIIK